MNIISSNSAWSFPASTWPLKLPSLEHDVEVLNKSVTKEGQAETSHRTHAITITATLAITISPTLFAPDTVLQQ